jgi:hypothetical protein
MARDEELKPFFSPNRDPTRYDFRKSAHIYSSSIGSRRARRPETFPKTANRCHFGAAKPLRPLQPFHSSPIEGMPASLLLVISH